MNKFLLRWLPLFFCCWLFCRCEGFHVVALLLYKHKHKANTKTNTKTKQNLDAQDVEAARRDIGREQERRRACAERL